jgi:hypothetical protein
VNQEIDAKQSVYSNDISEIETYESHAITIPLYNSEASAGIGHLQLSSEYVIDHLQVPFARETDIAHTIWRLNDSSYAKWRYCSC